jgi:hypothetical protein
MKHPPKAARLALFRIAFALSPPSRDGSEPVFTEVCVLRVFVSSYGWNALNDLND